MKRKGLALLLAALMLVSMLPTTAFSMDLGSGDFGGSGSYSSGSDYGGGSDNDSSGSDYSGGSGYDSSGSDYSGGSGYDSSGSDYSGGSDNDSSGSDYSGGSDSSDILEQNGGSETSAGGESGSGEASEGSDGQNNAGDSPAQNEDAGTEQSNGSIQDLPAFNNRAKIGGANPTESFGSDHRNDSAYISSETSGYTLFSSASESDSGNVQVSMNPTVPETTEPAEINAVIYSANFLLASGALENPVTPEDVHDALDTAVNSETDAAKELGILTPDGAGELVAGIAHAEADQALENAENVSKAAEAFTDAAADLAESHADKATDDAKDAKDAKDTAEAAAADADTALENAQNAVTEAELQSAVNETLDASLEAQRAANDAMAAAQDAEKEAQRAAFDYELAKAAYDAAVEEADRQLALGLINVEAAAEITAAAAQRADETYNAMVRAQELARDAVEAAQEKADAADADLQEKIDALNNAISENASEIASKTGTAVLTGAALTAAKIAAEATKLEVNYYENQIERREESIEGLKEKINNAQAAIDEAQDNVDAKKKTLDDADEDYAEKLAELTRAEDELAKAQNVVDNLSGILEERSNAEQAGVAAALDAVKNGTDDAEERKKVTEYVLSNLDKYDPAAESITIKEWDENEEGVFYVEDAEGKTLCYKVVTVDVKNEQEEVVDRFLQFVEYVPAHEEAVSNLPSAQDTWSGISGTGNTKTTDMKATKGENEYEVYVTKTKIIVDIYSYQVKVDGQTYTLSEDKSGVYYVKGLSKQYVTLSQSVAGAVVDGAVTGKSSTVTDAWDAADNADETLSAKQTAQTTAAQNVTDALNTKSSAEAAYNTAETTLKNLKSGQEADQQKLDELKNEIKNLNDQLKGGLSEQLVIAFLDNGLSDITETVVDNIAIVLGEETKAHYDSIQNELTDLRAQLEESSGLNYLRILGDIALREGEANTIRLRVLSSENISDNMDEIREQGAALAEVIKAVSDQELNMNDVSAVVNLLSNADFSAKTKEFVAGKIVDALAQVHHNAVENLRTAVGDGIEELSSALNDAAAAGVNVFESHAALTVANGAKLLTDTLVADAAGKKAAADKAAADAAEAASLYRRLINNFNISDENIRYTKAAMEESRMQADLAAQEAKLAQEAADRANEDYEIALRIVLKPPVRPVPVGPVLPARTVYSSRGRSVSAAEPYAFAYTPLGLSIAQYAASLKGSRYANLVKNAPEMLNSRAFVDFVYSHFNISLKLDGKTVEDVAKNGMLISQEDRAPGDLLALTADGGAVAGFGVNYDMNGFVRFNETTGLVEIAGSDALLGSCSVVRVA